MPLAFLLCASKMLYRSLSNSTILPARSILRRRCLTTASPIPRAVATSAESVEKAEGSIASVFSSLGGDAFVPLESRFSELKAQLFSDGLAESWRSVLASLEHRTDEIRQVGNAVRTSDRWRSTQMFLTKSILSEQLIPQVEYADVKAGLSDKITDKVKRVGSVVVHGAVPESEAVAWKEQIKAYIAKNSLARGFPDNDPQVWELYNSVAQTRARTHPGVLDTQKWLLSLFHTSDPNSPVSISTPISYYDRLRIRHPGDAVFALGPHIDGGSLERWEDPGKLPASICSPRRLGALQAAAGANT